MKRLALAAAWLSGLIQTGTTQWSTPVRLANVNTTALDYAPVPSFDGLTLYYSTTLTGGGDIYRATRTSRYGDFGAPALVPELVSTSEDWMSCLRVDELEIFFTSRRAGGSGGYDLWRADRASSALPFNPPVPVTELNTASVEYGASLTVDGLRVYFTTDRAGGSGGNDIWTATRPSWALPFGTPVPVTELNSANGDRDPRISPDGLFIVFCSDRPGGLGSTDLWMASRVDLVSPFSTPVNITAVNSAQLELNPAFTMFGDELLFCSGRPGGIGGWELYSSRFTGVRAFGIASQSSAQDLLFSDPSSAGLVYLAISSGGTVPGIPIDTRVLPLNPDLLFRLTVGGLPPIFNGYVGALDPDGVATGRLWFNGFPGLTGLRFFTAFVVIDPAAPSSIRTISNAHETLVQ